MIHYTQIDENQELASIFEDVTKTTLYFYKKEWTEHEPTKPTRASYYVGRYFPNFDVNIQLQCDEFGIPYTRSHTVSSMAVNHFLIAKQINSIRVVAEIPTPLTGITIPVRIYGCDETTVHINTWVGHVQGYVDLLDVNIWQKIEKTP